ncbi:MAG: hypothetical protein ACRBB0_19100 [Pelagimonas sp.]|uniref:hypothetical protein n=1 Tax=Pelagimonas sp. TaxID=2073170 RepID=UPI003D6BF74B
MRNVRILDLRDPQIPTASNTARPDLHVVWTDLMASARPFPNGLNIGPDHPPQIGADGILTLFRRNAAQALALEQLDEPIGF